MAGQIIDIEFILNNPKSAKNLTLVIQEILDKLVHYIILVCMILHE